MAAQKSSFDAIEVKRFGNKEAPTASKRKGTRPLIPKKIFSKNCEFKEIYKIVNKKCGMAIG